MPDYSSLRRGLVHYWGMDNGSYPYTQWDRMRTCNLSVFSIVPSGGIRVEGKLGHGCNLIGSPFGASTLTTVLFPTTTPTAVTLSLWFKMDAPEDSPYILNAQLLSPLSGSYYLRFLSAGTFRFSYTAPHALPIPGTPTVVDVAHSAVAGEWVHALLFIDISGQQIGLRINNGVPAWTHSANVSGWSLVTDVRFGPALEGVMDDSAVWSRLLKTHEQDWLWNDGNGLAFEEFGVVGDADDCQVIPCCETDPYTYQAASATPSGAATGSDCATLPVVAISPPQSSLISFPTHIILSSSVAGAVIRYTTDGNDPTEDSNLYDLPFQIYGPGTTVKACAWLGECVGPISVATYDRVDFDLTFRNICPPSPLRAGVWGDFAGGTMANYQWEIDITPTSPLHITAFEIYETNVAGVWNTGQAWSTQEYIDPPDSAPNFHVYPLVLDEGGQINAAYTDDFCTTYGDFSAAAHSIYAYGAIQTDLPGVTYFRMRLFLQNGDVVERIIASDTCDPPPCEQQPPDPTVVGACGGITVTFSTTAGNPYQLIRLDESGGAAVVVDSGTTLLGGNTFTDTATVAGVNYCYALMVQYGACPSYTVSNWVCAMVPPDPGLSVSQDVSEFCASSGTVQFTIESTSLLVGGACISNAVFYSYTDGTGLHTGSVTGNTTVLLVLAMTRPPQTGVDSLGRPTYVVTVTFTACNPCGTVTEIKTVTFQPDAQCTAANLPARPMVVDIATLIPAVQATTLNCLDPNAACYALQLVGTFPAWTGDIPYRSSCEYVLDQQSVTLCPYQCEAGIKSLGPVFASVGFFTDHWELTVHLSSGDYDIALWTGTKICGYDPVGTYTRTAGCVTTLAQLSVT